MSGMHKGLFFIPEMLADKVVAGLAGKKALSGTGVVRILTTLPKGPNELGETVKVPYFTSLGRMEKLVGDQQASTPDSISSNVEEAIIQHAAKSFSATQWSQWNGLGNVYDMAAAQIGDMILEHVDDESLAEALKPTAGNANVTDVSAEVTANKLDHDSFLEARSKWGDESDGITALVVHSQTEKALRKLRDDAGRPLITDMVDGRLSRFNGVEIVVSDKMPSVSGTFTSLLCKKDAIIFWMNGNPRFRTDQDALGDVDLAAVHIYYAAHRYKLMSGRTTPGIQIVKHKN
jgi:Phage capsid family